VPEGPRAAWLRKSLRRLDFGDQLILPNSQMRRKRRWRSVPAIGEIVCQRALAVPNVLPHLVPGNAGRHKIAQHPGSEQGLPF
jgi:hypothetical protein